MMSAATPVGGSPLLQQGGAGLQSSGRAFDLKLGFSPGISRCPALKRTNRVEPFPGALKRSFPRMNAGAHTNLLGSNHCNSNRNTVRIEISVSHRKQRKATNPNRNSFRGSSKRREEKSWRGGGSAKAKRDPSTTTRVRRTEAGKTKTRGSSRGMTTKDKGAGLTLRLHSPRRCSGQAGPEAAATWAKRKTPAMIQIPRSIFRISRPSPGGAWSHDSGPNETPGARLRSSDTPRLHPV
jgi:hypothetical protein